MHAYHVELAYVNLDYNIDKNLLASMQIKLGFTIDVKYSIHNNTLIRNIQRPNVSQQTVHREQHALY